MWKGEGGSMWYTRRYGSEDLVCVWGGSRDPASYRTSSHTTRHVAAQLWAQGEDGWVLRTAGLPPPH